MIFSSSDWKSPEISKQEASSQKDHFRLTP
jgi:hypothetical protein